MSPRYFSLDRLQDLVVGLTSCYRYGFLSSAHEPEDDKSSAVARLAQRGEHVARQVLLHPGVTTSEIASLIVSAPTPPHSPPLPLTPSMVFALSTPPQSSASSPTNPEARPKPPTRALSAPIYSRHSHLSVETKQSLTVRVNALYILALQAWPHHKAAAERYWQAAVAVADSVGGFIGTKEGDEIVFKARRRLQTEASPDESWRTVKQSSKTAQSSAPINKRTVQRREVSDALTDMARTQESTARSNAGSSDSQLRTAVSSGHMHVAGSYFDWHTAPAHERASPPLRHFITTKFSQTDYPSPPETPDNSPPTDTSVSSGPPAPFLRRVTSTANFRPPHILRRATSSTSISTVPPNFGRPRGISGSTWHGVQTTTQTASVLARPRPSRIVSSPLSRESTPVAESSSHWTTGLRQRLRTIKTGVAFVNPFKRQTNPPSATSMLRRVIAKDNELLTQVVIDWGEDPDQLEELEVGATDSSPETSPRAFHQAAAPIVNVRFPGKSVSSPPSLRFVPTGESARRPLSKQRSYIDVTNPRPIKTLAQHAIPQIVCQPPTPQRDHLLPPRPGPRPRRGRVSRRSSLHKSSGSSSDSQDDSSGSSTPTNTVDPWTSPKTQASALPPLDPFLAQLEKNSRVGLQTTCHECGKQGLNFSACPRCQHLFCSRECRIKSGGEANKHVCRVSSHRHA
ncbi:hypothetical protein ACM66B_002343 [Microbotryomycetes sp. NB124-2]